MPVSVVVGGQYGSEGKGKVAYELARREGGSAVVVRVGGPNSGHTAYDAHGKRWMLRQLPVAAVAGVRAAIIASGSYIQLPLLLREIGELGLTHKEVVIDPFASIITDAHLAWERRAAMAEQIASTATGSGAATLAAIDRQTSDIKLPAIFAHEVAELRPYIRPVDECVRNYLEEGHRVIIEGTQGFGLAIRHSRCWPYTTSRDTTAGTFIGETGVSPLDVDDITLVIRTFPIRVPGSSGPLPHELDWETVTDIAGAPHPLSELTSVTRRERRIARFDSQIVRRAINVNQPTRLVLNHIDYVDWQCRSGVLSHRARHFVSKIEKELDRRIDWVGTSERTLIDFSPPFALRA